VAWRPSPAAGDLQVRLVAPRVWRPLVTDAFAALEGRGPHAVRLAETILWTLHNRHVGITPWLVAQLTPILVEPRFATIPGASPGAGPAGERGWQLVLRRLLWEITPPARDGAPAGRYHSGIALGASPTYTLLKVLTPLILAACGEIGQNCLFAGDDEGTTVTHEQYFQYMQQLATAILRRASSVPDPDPETGELPRDPSWYEPAMTLASFVRGGPAHIDTRRTPALPSADPVELSLLLRLRPRITDHSWARKRRLSTPTAPTRGNRRREEGYVGIHVTHRDEDLPAMLLSEAMMPRLLRLDRLLNTGFYALERTPRRQRVRDVLLIGILPPALAGRAGADFVKASWVDCALRLSTLLRQHRLLKSELRWIEGDAFDRQRTCTFRLDDIPASDPADATVDLTQARREGLLNAMGWLPAFVDERAQWRETSAPSAAGLGADLTPLLDSPAGQSVLPSWIFESWRAQQARARHTASTARYRRRPAARTGTRAGPNVAASPDDEHPLDSFAYAHVMLFLPASLRPTEGFAGGGTGTLLAELRSRFGFGGRADRHVSITWVPEGLDGPETWRVDTRRRIGQTLVDPDDHTTESDTLDENDLAGRLVTTWLLTIAEELAGG
jgi:hypothetical protein